MTACPNPRLHKNTQLSNYQINDEMSNSFSVQQIYATDIRNRFNTLIRSLQLFVSTDGFISLEKRSSKHFISEQTATPSVLRPFA